MPSYNYAKSTPPFDHGLHLNKRQAPLISPAVTPCLLIDSMVYSEQDG